MVKELRLRIILLIAGVGLLLGLASCGGQGPQRNENYVKLAPNTKVADSSAENQLLDISDDATYLKFASGSTYAQTLSPGDIVVFGASDKTPNGLLRKVVRKSEDSQGGYVLETQPAALDDAIEEANIEIEQPLKPSSVAAVNGLLRGISVSKVAPESLEIPIQLDDIILYDRDRDLSTTNDQVRLSGEMALETSLKTKIRIHHHKLEYMSFALVNSEEGSITATWSFAFSGSKEVSALQIKFSPMVFFISGFPLVIVPEINVAVGVEASLNGTLTSNVSERGTMTVGLEYDNGNFDTLFQKSLTFSNNLMPALDASLDATAYLEPELEFALYGVSGPYASVKPYLNLQADINADPWWVLYGGVEANVGVNLPSFTSDIEGGESSWSHQLFDERVQILTANDEGSGDGGAGASWTARNSGTENSLGGVVYGNNIFAAVGQGGTILTSTDGTSWTSRNSGTGKVLRDITYDNNTFVVVGRDGTILTSTDGTSWTSRNSGTGNNLYDVAYGNNTFVAVGASGTILTSTDGVSWTSRNSGTYSGLNDVVFGNSTFVVAGDGGKILTSTDGTSWTSRNSGTGDQLRGVVYHNNTFVAVGEGGTILTSTDGTSWTSQSSGTGNSLVGAAYGDSAFVVVGVAGTILTSTDGTSWTSQSSGTGNDLFGVTYGNNIFVAVGESGTILTSP